MLQNIRRNFQGTIAKVVVAIIIVPFALFGIETLFGGGGVQYAARVNGEGISRVDLQQEIYQQRQRLIRTFGEDIDPAMLDERNIIGPALEFLIEQEIIAQTAADYGLAVTNERLNDVIIRTRGFQDEGMFNPDLYRRVLSDAGYTVAGYQRTLRAELVNSQLRGGLVDSEFATPLEVDRLGVIRDEQRDVRYLSLPLDTFIDAVTFGEDDVQAWYEANEDRFLTEESVDLEYIELTLDDFRAPVGEDRLREVFEVERDSFEVPEQRRAAHILFERGEDESEEELQARIAAAQERLAAGEAFEDVAADASDDLGSAAFGGDLGLTAGDSLPEPLEAALAQLAEGEVSDLVTTDAGQHILKLTEVLPGQAADFDAVRDQLQLRLQDEDARLALVKAVEELRDLAFNADGLAGPAEQLAVAMQTATGVKREGNEGLFADPRLAAAAFAEDVLDERYNSEVIELTPDQFVALRVVEHRLPALRPLEDVRDEVEAALRDELAREQVEATARALLAELAAGGGIEELAQRDGHEWQVELGAKRDNQTLPEHLLRRLFELPPPAEGETTFEYVQSESGDIEVFELVRVIPTDAADLEDNQRSQLQRELSRERSGLAERAYQRWLIEDASIITEG